MLYGGLMVTRSRLETEAAARSRRRRTLGYVKESDAATTKVYDRIRVTIIRHG
jgi:hypothetical protein